MQKGRPGDVILFYATESLVCQVAEWAKRHGDVGVHLLSTRDPVAIRSAAEGTALAILDATDWPGAAMAALECYGEDARSAAVAVYTEQAHAGLELFVRERGVRLLPGPMSPAEWEVWLDALGTGLATIPLRSSAFARAKNNEG
jgi:hypothetical protein